MRKPVLGLLLGGLLGAFDGLSSLVTAGDDPAVRADILLIVSMGVFKGTIAGLVIGFFSRKFDSLPVGIVFGLAVGVVLAAPIAIMQGQYYWQIMLPGGLVGAIVGFAVQRYGERAVSQETTA